MFAEGHFEFSQVIVVQQNLVGWASIGIGRMIIAVFFFTKSIYEGGFLIPHHERTPFYKNHILQGALDEYRHVFGMTIVSPRGTSGDQISEQEE